MRRDAGVSALVTFMALAFAASSARADGFQYVDRDGREHVVRVEAPESSPSQAQAPQSAPPSPPPPSTPGPEDDAFPYASLLTEAAELYALPRELVCAVMKVESGGNPNAVSSSGALGLMQLMPFTAADLGLTDAFDPRQNVFGGARFLRVLVNTFQGDLPLALAAYHAGAGRVQRSGGVPDIPATRRYISKVLATFHALTARTHLPALSVRAAR